MKEKTVILIAGPTASGKSILAIKLAKHFDSEIINADSMQIYKEVSVLTSKPTSQDTTNIKHHLYGINSVKKKFSTGQWLELVLKKIETQWYNKKIPIVVGGTGLYFKALTEGLVKIPEIPSKIREEIRNLHEKVGQKFFFNLLIKLDPLAKNFVLPTDKQRSLRVYEVKKFTNKSLFELIRKTKSNFEKKTFKKLFINPPKELLHKSIEDRVDKMLNSGAIKEVERFTKMNIYHELSANKIIGIKEIKNYLNGKLSIEEARQLIIQNTRRYAKRQFTWSRGHMKSWDKIYSPNINDLYKKALNKIF